MPFSIIVSVLQALLHHSHNAAVCRELNAPLRRAGCNVTLTPLLTLLNALKPIDLTAREPASPIQRGTLSRCLTRPWGPVIKFLSGSAGERCEVRGRGTYGVLLGPGESRTRRRLPHEECCRHREGLQLLLRVTFITTINMHATHRHAGLQLMFAQKARVKRRWSARMTRLAEKQCIEWELNVKIGTGLSRAVRLID